jgi:glucose/mannose transport system substrate-binding protein
MKSKRFLMLGLVAVMMLVFSACVGESKDSAKDTTSTSSAAGNQQSNGGKAENEKLQIFSWWITGGEAKGLENLISMYKEKYPGSDVLNEAVGGGVGDNAKAVLASRIQAGNPPDTFQVHAGEELKPWLEAGVMKPINDLYEEEGWQKVFPKSLVDSLTKNGKIYTVPLNIHRGNVIWYNPKIFKDNNLTPPKTLDDFFKVAEVLKQKGITPLALGTKDTWSATALWETILLASAGDEKYGKLFKGEASFSDQDVKQATELFKRALTYLNDNASAILWNDAAQMVTDGKAAMTLTGDWAKSHYITSLGLKLGQDFDWIPFPGTSDYFIYTSDTFGIPEKAPHPQGIRNFLKIVGSAEGQKSFNLAKGSIPARTDVDTSDFDSYGKAAIQDFKTKKLVPSLTHGVAANPAFLTQVTQEMNAFLNTKDVNQFLAALDSAAKQFPLK